MAANKFATMLHRRTNKITLILIYAVLEWVLIVLLLLNSLFSYLIIKFASYFGLKPPCLWCSRVDHIFETGENKNMHRDLLCEAHAREISKLGFCLNHRKLAESKSMCEDCLSSTPDFDGFSKNFGFFPWMQQVGFVQSHGDKVSESDEVCLKCSCCGLSFDNKTCSPSALIKPSWGVLDRTLDGNLIGEIGDKDHTRLGKVSDRNGSDSLVDRLDDEQVNEFDREIEMLFDVNGGFGVREAMADKDFSVSVCVPASVSGLRELETDENDKEVVVLEDEKEAGKEEDKSNAIIQDPTSYQAIVQVSSREEDSSLEILPQHLEFFIDYSGQRLVPVELIDSATEEDQSKTRAKEEDQSKNRAIEKDQEYQNCQCLDLGSEFSVKADDEPIEKWLSSKETESTLAPLENEKAHEIAVLDSVEVEESEVSRDFHVKRCDLSSEAHEEDANPEKIETAQEDVGFEEQATAEGEECCQWEEENKYITPVSAEPYRVPTDGNEAHVTIVTEVPDTNVKDELTIEENLSYDCKEENPSSSSANPNSDGGQGCGEHMRNHQLTLSTDVNDIEEEKVPDTPTSTESFYHLHKKLLILGRKDSGTEDSLDCNGVIELEGGEGSLTIERLKAALKAERNALHALYSELEEERSASAIAANQTMAMINRLQEEKAAMQMEALQYQRMMEEQSEYDQEALQLLNELMVKREKEKQELEKELEIYRRKLFDYEAKEKIRALRRSRDGSSRSETSSASCSHTEDSDAQSADLNQETKEDFAVGGHQETGIQHTPLEGILNLEGSLADFEEERISILEQLKALEEKLMTLSDEEEQHFDKVSPIEDLHEENGNHLYYNSDVEGEMNDYANGFHKDMNGKQHLDSSVGSNAKTLLPLFDAVSSENGDGTMDGNHNGFSSNGVHKTAVRKSELENKRVDIEDEVDHLYERLQALEADREFLKHCIGSLKKGDKGMELLQEILQHLRDLRNVELRAKNFNDTPEVMNPSFLLM